MPDLTEDLSLLFDGCHMDNAPPKDTGTANQDMSSISLIELAKLHRLRDYHERKRSEAEQRLQILRTSWAIRDRLIQGESNLLGELSTAVHDENQKCFIQAFQAFQTIEVACQDNDRTKTILPPESDLEPGTTEYRSESFMNRLSNASRDDVSLFIRTIADSPDFLIRHLSCLSDKDFNTLLKYHLPSESSSSRASVISQSTAYKEKPNSGRLDLILDLGRHDFLSLLLQIVGTGRPETSPICFTHYWAKVCASLFSDRKSGAGKFVVAVMNVFPRSGRSPKPHVLENWLLQVLRDGDFLLEKTDKYSFRMRVQPRENLIQEDTDAADKFFNQSMTSLLEILKDTYLTDAIPDASLKLGKAIVDQLRISGRHYEAAPYFLCSRWLFSSYLADIIKTPETFGFLLSTHISLNARTRILKELANRLHKLAFDVEHTWKHCAAIDANLLNSMHAVVSLFQPDGTVEYSSTFVQPAKITGQNSNYGNNNIVLCPSDLMTLVHGLFPEPVPNLGLFSPSLGGSIFHSSASSVSGFSMLQDSSSDTGLLSDGGMSPPWLPQPHTPMPDHNFHGLQESATDDSTEFSLIQRLRSVCHNLSLVRCLDTAPQLSDPFRENWASIAVSREFPYSDCSKGHSCQSSKDDNNSECGPLSGSQTQIKEALGLLLDHLEWMHSTPTDRVLSHSQSSSKKPSDGGDVVDDVLDSLVATSIHLWKERSFTKAHLFHKAAKRIELSVQSYAMRMWLIGHMERMAARNRRSISAHRSVTKQYNIQADAFELERKAQLLQIKQFSSVLSRLREKMWYISNVRYTGPYEDLSRVASALKTMGLPHRQLPPEKVQPPLRRCSTSTALHGGTQLKAVSAVLDILSTPLSHGGPNKLNDKQIALTVEWLSSHNIDNICKSEERLLRLCHEVSRCADSLVGDNIAEHPVLWSSELFKDVQPSARQCHSTFDNASPSGSARERLEAMYNTQQHQGGVTRLSSPVHFGARDPPSRLSTPSQDWFYDTGFSHLSRSSSEYSRSCSPTLTNDTSASMWSSFTTGQQTLSSSTSFPSYVPSRTLSDRSSNGSLSMHRSRKEFLDELKQNVVGLLLSDVGGLFLCGSETDLGLWSSFDGRFARAISTASPTKIDASQSSPMFGREFGPDDAFQNLLSTFDVLSSPFEKLKILHQVQELCQCLITTDETDSDNSANPILLGSSPRATHTSTQFDCHIRANGVSYTKTDSASAFRHLFLNSSMRPKALFRDLQYIAALVPSNILNNSEEGHAFWNATIAALSVQEDITHAMIETADAIIKHHTQTRGHSSTASSAQAQRDSATFTTSRPGSATAAAEKVSQYTMADAADLYLIAAKTGDCTAQRELATLYLTHPEMMKRVVAPFAKAEDVFKGAAVTEALREEGRKANSGAYTVYGGYGGYGTREEVVHGKYDAVAMAIARHWMELAAKGGDELAKNTLRATDEIERIP